MAAKSYMHGMASWLPLVDESLEYVPMHLFRVKEET
jgi:hypothetical protein